MSDDFKLTPKAREASIAYILDHHAGALANPNVAGDIMGRCERIGLHADPRPPGWVVGTGHYTIADVIKSKMQNVLEVDPQTGHQPDLTNYFSAPKK